MGYFSNSDVVSKKVVSKEIEPYIVEEVVVKIRKYNPKYGNNKVCTCGHTYERHFDFYESEEFQNCGCKYCPCKTFEEVQ